MKIQYPLEKYIGRNIGFDAAFLFLGNGIQLISGTLFYVILSHFFNASIVGEITIFVAVITLSSVIFTFGLNLAVQHFISISMGDNNDNPRRIFLREIMPLAMMLAFASFISIYLLSSDISQIFFHSSSYTGLIRLASYISPFSIIFSILGGSLLGVGRYRLSALLNIIVFSIYYMGASVISIRYHDITLSLYVWLVSMFIGTIAGSILVLYSMKHMNGVPSVKVGKNQIVKYSTPLLVSQIISTGAAYADRLIVTGLTSVALLGVYTYALLFSTAVIFIVGPFNNILLTKLSYYKGTRDMQSFRYGMSTSIDLLNGLIFPISFGLASITPLALYVFIGPGYVGGQYAMEIILLIIPFFLTSNIYAQGLNSLKKTKVFLISSSSSLIANFVISVITIPYIGIEGAAIGYSSTYIVSFIINSLMFRREVKGVMNLTPLMKITFSSLIMFVVIQVFYYTIGINMTPSYAILIEILMGAFIYKTMEFITKPFSNETWNFIYNTFPHRRLYTIMLRIIL